MLALLVIDMINAFIEEESPLCVPNAKRTAPKIRKVVDACRENGIPVCFVGREYRLDGSDVELSRWSFWNDNGRPITQESEKELSGDFYEQLMPQDTDHIIIKRKWSAFFRTELDLILRRLGVDTVVVTGTQTPNCIRATVFDADSNDFETIILSDCVSSKSEEVQKSNLNDFVNAGFTVLESEDFLMRLEEFKTRKSKLDRIKRDVQNFSAGT